MKLIENWWLLSSTVNDTIVIYINSYINKLSPHLKFAEPFFLFWKHLNFEHVMRVSLSLTNIEYYFLLVSLVITLFFSFCTMFRIPFAPHTHTISRSVGRSFIPFTIYSSISSGLIWLLPVINIRNAFACVIKIISYFKFLILLRRYQPLDKIESRIKLTQIQQQF